MTMRHSFLPQVLFLALAALATPVNAGKKAFTAEDLQRDVTWGLKRIFNGQLARQNFVPAKGFGSWRRAFVGSAKALEKNPAPQAFHTTPKIKAEVLQIKAEVLQEISAKYGPNTARLLDRHLQGISSKDLCTSIDQAVAKHDGKGLYTFQPLRGKAKNRVDTGGLMQSVASDISRQFVKNPSLPPKYRPFKTRFSTMKKAWNKVFQRRH